MAIDKETQQERAPRPAWFSEMWSDYQAGMANVFVLHGHVHDYIDHPDANLTLREYLEQLMGTRFALATFSPDEGILFPGDELESKASAAWLDKVLGRDSQSAEAPGTFNAAALLAAQAQTSGSGFGGGSTGEPLPSDAPRALALLIDYLKQANDRAEGVPIAETRTGRFLAKRAAVLVERLDLIMPPAEKDRLGGGDRALLSLLHRSGTSPAINRQRNLMVLLAPSLEEIHPDLRLAASGIRTIEVPPPDYEQRLAFCTRAVAEVKNEDGEVTREAIELEDLQLTDLATQTAGLNRRHIEDLVLRAVQTDGVITREMVKARKREQISAEYAEVLEILEPDVTFDMVGGHDAVKEYLREWVIDPMRDPDPEGLNDVPMGILFAGPSGTGKTYLARALANESGYNCVSMAPDNIRGSYVGESEKKLRKAIQGVEAMAPVILFIDEIDQKLRRTSGGGGGGDSVEGNIFGKMLEFLSDTRHRGSILLVAATNEPQSIDPALQRPGRIDNKIPLLPPDTAEERADALGALARRHGLVGATEGTLLDVGGKTDSWTQAELEALVVKSRAYVRRKKLPAAEAFAAVLERMRPSTAGIRRHIELAVRCCDDASLVPARWRSLVGTAPAPQPVATPVAPSGTGRVAAGADGFDLDDIS